MTRPAVSPRVPPTAFVRTSSISLSATSWAGNPTSAVSDTDPPRRDAREHVLHNRGLIATVTSVDLEREPGVRMPRETGERGRRELEVGREHRCERMTQRVPRQPLPSPVQL